MAKQKTKKEKLQDRMVYARLLQARNQFMGCADKGAKGRVPILKEEKGGSAAALKASLDEALILDYKNDFGGNDLQDADPSLVLYMHEALGLPPIMEDDEKAFGMDDDEEELDDLDLDDESDEEELDDGDEEELDDESDVEFEDGDEEEENDEEELDDLDLDDEDGDEEEPAPAPEKPKRAPRAKKDAAPNVAPGVVLSGTSHDPIGRLEAVITKMCDAIVNGASVAVYVYPKGTPPATITISEDALSPTSADVAASSDDDEDEIELDVDEAPAKKAPTRKRVSSGNDKPASRKPLVDLTPKERFVRDRTEGFRRQVLYKKLQSDDAKRRYIKKHDIKFAGAARGKGLSQLTGRSMSIAILDHVRTLAESAYAEKQRSEREKKTSASASKKAPAKKKAAATKTRNKSRHGRR